MRKHTTLAVLLASLLCVSVVAHAQFAWIDEKGVRHYSDQPPPPDVPDAKILHAPRGAQRAPAADSTPAASPDKAAPTWVEREAESRKRREETEKAATKSAADKKSADAKLVACDAAARNKAQIDSGRRLRMEDRTVVTEEDKARQLAQIDKVLKDCR